MTITSKLEFDQASATLSARMVSLDKHTRITAAQEAADLLINLPKFLSNSPHCKFEIDALENLINSII